MQRQFAFGRVNAAQNSGNGLNLIKIHGTPVGAPMLVYRPEVGKWEVLFSLPEVCGEEDMVLASKGTQKFCRRVVKRYFVDTATKKSSN